MADCPFCQIIGGDRTASIIVEDDHTISFLDGQPATHGHTLVAPKKHLEFLFRGDDPIPRAVLQSVNVIARGIDRTLEPDGISLFYTSGRLVGRVSHAHVHVVPRYEDDDIHVDLRRDYLDDDHADDLVGRIRSNLD